MNSCANTLHATYSHLLSFYFPLCVSHTHVELQVSLLKQILLLSVQDGLKEGPIKLADLDDTLPWLDKVLPAIQARIESHAQNEIRFSLLAVCSDKRQEARRRLETTQSERDSLKQRLESSEELPEPIGGAEGARSRLQQLESHIVSLTEQIEQEEQKRYEQRRENVRRKHNYIPFIFNFLKVRARHFAPGLRDNAAVLSTY